MGIIISKDLTIHGTIIINGAYLRLEPKINKDGTIIEIKVWSYHSKEAYYANHNNVIHIDYQEEDVVETGLEYCYFPYNRETDGVDILKFAHDKMIEYLTTDKVDEEKTVIREKFAEKTKVTDDLATVKEEEETQLK